jgi:hypothetical protein
VFAILLPDLPGFCVEQIEKTEKGIRITARATASSACCPDCQQASSRVHSYYTRCLMDLPASGRPIWLLLHVRHFRCSNRACPRKTFAEPLPDLLLPHAQRTSRLRESLRKLGEEGGGEAGARMSKQQGMAWSASTILRLLHHGPLPTPSPVKVLGGDEWAWRKGQSYGTILVDLERHLPVDLLQDASADSFAAWLKEHPSVELISRAWHDLCQWGQPWGSSSASDCRSLAYYSPYGRGAGEGSGEASCRSETHAESRRREPGDRRIGPTSPGSCHSPLPS